VGCIVVSRAEPPQEFARLLRNQAIGEIVHQRLESTTVTASCESRSCATSGSSLA
jgi:hypothetical protein